MAAVIVLSASLDAVRAGPSSGVEVHALDDYFIPSSASAPRGGTVTWAFTMAERSHTVTDTSGMDLIDSGIVPPGGPSFA